MTVNDDAEKGVELLQWHLDVAREEIARLRAERLPAWDKLEADLRLALDHLGVTRPAAATAIVAALREDGCLDVTWTDGARAEATEAIREAIYMRRPMPKIVP